MLTCCNILWIVIICILYEWSSYASYSSDDKHQVKRGPGRPRKRKFKKSFSSDDQSSKSPHAELVQGTPIVSAPTTPTTPPAPIVSPPTPEPVISKKKKKEETPAPTKETKPSTGVSSVRILANLSQHLLSQT